MPPRDFNFFLNLIPFTFFVLINCLLSLKPCKIYIMDHLNILSLNCFGLPFIPKKKLRFTAITEKIIKTNPDIVLLQEVWMKKERQLLAEKLSKAYTVYPIKHKNYCSGGLVLFVKKLIIYNYKFHKFNNQGPLTLISLPDRIGGKGFQSFELIFNGEKVLVINAHLLCAYGRDTRMIDAIKNQLEQIINFVDNTKMPVMIIGDLNLLPDDQEIIDFKHKLGLIDGLSNDENTIDINNLNRGKVSNVFSPKSFRTDYILTNTKVNVIEEKVIFKEIINKNGIDFQLSDHFGIKAKIIC